MSEQINKVCANIAQNFSEEQKARARSNIGVDLSSLATKAELDNKQDTIIAGPNINIYGSTISTEKAAVTAGANVSVTSSLDSANRIVTYNISATDTTYSAGSGLNLNGTEFSVDTSVIQPKLTAGTNVQINDNVISATDTTYSAGANVQINGTVISATDTTYSAGSGLSLNGTTFSVDTSVVQPKLTAGSNITIDSSNVISATDTTYSAGTNVQINNGVISATDTTYTAGSGIALNGTEFSNTAPNVKSDWNAAAGSAAEILNKPFVSKVVYSDWQGDMGYDVNVATLTIDSDSHKVSGAGYNIGVIPPYPSTTESGNRALMLSSQSRVPAWQAVYSKSETDTLLGTKQSTLTAGTNVSIDANNVISATDTTYTAGAYISISNANVIENTMHLDTTGLLVSYNTLGNSGTTNHSFGPWRIQIEKAAMATWDSASGNASVHIKFGHADYLEGGITAGSILQDTYNPWYGWTFSSAQFSHTCWGFDGSMASGPTGGFPIYLTSPMDSDSVARTCPHSMQGHRFRINGGIATPDWLELTVEPVYINTNTSLTSNAARLLIQVKYFYA